MTGLKLHRLIAILGRRSNGQTSGSLPSVSWSTVVFQIFFTFFFSYRSIAVSQMFILHADLQASLKGWSVQIPDLPKTKGGIISVTQW